MARTAYSVDNINFDTVLAVLGVGVAAYLVFVGERFLRRRFGLAAWVREGVRRISLPMVFLPFVFLQVIGLAVMALDVFFWTGMLAITAVCFLVLDRLPGVKNPFVVVLVLTVRGFFAAWVLMWILLLRAGLMGETGPTSAVYGVIPLVLFPIIGFWIGIFRLFARRTRRQS